jgi:4-cresol dehydrogenase (hydroxylating)
MPLQISEDSDTNIRLAIHQWSEAIGVEYVKHAAADLLAEERTAFLFERKIVALLRPATAAELQQIIQIARQNLVQIYAISTGKNWGLGSAVPTADNCVLVKLDRMNRISDFSESMAYVKVQPGVTFKQLWDFLESQQSSLMLDGIAGSQHASVLGNTMERGQGVGLYADRFANVCGLTVVIPNGDIIKTGFAAFPGSKNQSLAKWGLGPQLDGLFTQSNLGIVTEMTLWLRPKPTHFQVVLFHVDSRNQLGALTEAIRQLRLEKLPMSVRIYNDVRMFSNAGQYPWDETDGRTPLPKAVKAKLRSKMQIGKWIGIAGLYSMSNSMAKAERKLIKKRLGKLVNSIEFYSDKTIEKAQHFSEAQKDSMVRRSLLRGYVTDDILKITYWRKKMDVPQHKDLLRDRVGMLWYCPVVPANAESMQRMTRETAKIHKAFGFEMNIGFLSITERTFDTTGVILYDLDNQEEAEQALRCHTALQVFYREVGFTSYRLGLLTMDEMNDMDASTKQFLQHLKLKIDPLDCFSPGRYIPK